MTTGSEHAEVAAAHGGQRGLLAQTTRGLQRCCLVQTRKRRIRRKQRQVVAQVGSAGSITVSRHGAERNQLRSIGSLGSSGSSCGICRSSRLRSTLTGRSGKRCVTRGTLLRRAWRLLRQEIRRVHQEEGLDGGQQAIHNRSQRTLRAHSSHVILPASLCLVRIHQVVAQLLQHLVQTDPEIRELVHRGHLAQLTVRLGRHGVKSLHHTKQALVLLASRLAEGQKRCGQSTLH
mmetsp:Transcript_40760/g.70539  ORF Transcript_40760/g.70539 Transcript_40760/m.70539 type:complete len:233 (+) Transcript_40760:1453-2151(+)